MGKAKRLRQLKKIQARREQRTAKQNENAVETLQAIPVSDRIVRRLPGRTATCAGLRCGRGGT